MKVPLLALAASFLLCSGAFAAEKPGEIPGTAAAAKLLTLTRAYDLATLRSETLGQQDEAVKAAQARYWQSVGRVLPSVKIVMIEAFENKKSYGNSYAFGTQSTDYFEAKVHARQPIFAGLREYRAASGYSSEIEARRHSRDRASQLLYLDVASSFYEVIGYEKNLVLRVDLVQVLEQRMEELNRRVSLGKSRRSELLQSKTELAEARIDVEQANGMLLRSREQLAFLTGLEASELALEDTQDLPAAPQLQVQLGHLPGRPDLLAAEKDKTFAEKQVQIARGEFWPTIWAEGNWYAVKDPDSERDWDVLFQLEFPLFEGGTTMAHLREEKSNLQVSQLKASEITRRGNLEVRQSFHDLTASLQEMLRLEEALTVAEENYEVQKKDFNVGRSTNLDVLSALRKVFELRQRRVLTEAQTKIQNVRMHVQAGGGISP